jgi:hypothetical protein
MIHIIDNFLEKKEFEYFKDFLKNCNFIEYHFSTNKINSSEETIGYRHIFNLNSEIGNIFNNKSIEKFKYKITETIQCVVDIKKLNFYKPHSDISKMNLYFQIDGNTELDHGIGFYNDDKLNVKIGFKQNRAILFNAKLIHSPLVCENITRTTLTMFIKEGSFI